MREICMKSFHELQNPLTLPTQVMETINQFSRQRGRVIEYQDLLYGYYRLDPLHGADYILDLLLKYKKYRGRKMTVPVRRHAYLQQQFTGFEIREVENAEDLTTKDDKDGDALAMQDVLETSLQKFREQFPLLIQQPAMSVKITKIVNFILPLSGRFETFLRFIRTYEEACLEESEAVALVVVLFRGLSIEEIQAANRTLSYLADLRHRYPSARITAIPVADGFARALALQIGTTYVPNDDRNILFYIDVDMVFTKGTLERVRRNTIKGKQVYFPVVFSEFDPAVVYGRGSPPPSHFLITADSGYWRQFGFGIASAFRSDVEAAGGFNTAIRGWGKEDVDLFDRLLGSKVKVFRAADPTLVHVFHVVDCASDLEPTQLLMCQGTRADTYGSVSTLANVIFMHEKPFFDFAKNFSKKESLIRK